MASVGVIAGNGHFDHSAKVLSARFLHSKVIIFLFVIKEYLVGGYTEITQVPCYSSNLHSLALTSIGDFCLNSLL